MDVRRRILNRKNSIDRWTPSFDYKEKIEEDNSKPSEEVKKNKFVLPSLGKKLMMVKSKSDTKCGKPVGKVFALTTRNTPAFPSSEPIRLIYKAKSPTLKIVKTPVLAHISLSPFENDATTSNSPRYHYGQECIKNLFMKK